MSRSCKSCGSALGRHTVQKDGPNKGDAFYSCPNNQANVLCGKSFDWEDKVKHPDRKTPYGYGGMPPRSASSAAAPAGAVGPGFLTEATGQALLQQVTALYNHLNQAATLAPGPDGMAS